MPIETIIPISTTVESCPVLLFALRNVSMHVQVSYWIASCHPSLTAYSRRQFRGSGRAGIDSKVPTHAKKVCGCLGEKGNVESFSFGMLQKPMFLEHFC